MLPRFLIELPSDGLTEPVDYELHPFTILHASTLFTMLFIKPFPMHLFKLFDYDDVKFF